MKSVPIIMFALWSLSQLVSAERTVEVTNFGEAALPITNDAGLGMSGSWAVGRYTGEMNNIDPRDVLSNFDRNGSEGGSFIQGHPGFLSANVADTRVVAGEDSDRFAGEPIMVLIGNNPLGLSQSTGFILIDSGQTWVRENGDAQVGYSINLVAGNIIFGTHTIFSGGKDFFAVYDGGAGVTFPRLVTSAGPTFTSLINVTAITTSGNQGGLKITIQPEEASASSAAWKLPSQTTIRSSGQQVLGLPAGIYAIKFLDTGGYNTPPDYGVEIVSGELREYLVEYTELTLAPLITSVERTSGSFRLSWRSQTIQTYAVEYSQTLNESDWIEIANGITSPEQEAFYEDTAAPRIIRNSGFYRVRAE